jgi:hypothetical protein
LRSPRKLGRTGFASSAQVDCKRRQRESAVATLASRHRVLHSYSLHDEEGVKR